MKRFILFGILVFCTTPFLAQIGGTVVDNAKQPIYGVTIAIEGSNLKTATDIDGKFNFPKVSGSQTLVISSIGFKTKHLNIKAPKSNINIILFEGNELLEEIVLTGSKNKFSRKKTAYVAKLPLKNIENSQVYSTITDELLISQNVNSFQDALKNVVGIDKLWQSTGRAGDGAGYYSLRGFATQPQLVNGMPGVTNGFINPFNVERVEVIKGPSATLFGSTVTSYGGLINIVTKKPKKGTTGNISLGGGSFNFKKMVLDINTTSESEKFSLRFNAGFQSEDSFQDAGFNESVFMAPSITYQVNDKLTFNVSYELSANEQTNPVFLFFNRYGTLAFNNVEELNYDYNKSLTDNSVSIKNPTQNLRAEAVYKISDRITSQTIFSTGNAKSNGYYSYLWNFADFSGPTPAGTPYFSTYAQRTNATTNSLDIQQNFTGDFKIGNVRNRVLVGIDYLQTQSIDNGSGYAYINTLTAQGDLLDGSSISASVIDNATSGLATTNTNVNQNVFSVYASDVINVLPELSLMAGIRYDRFSYRGDKNTPDDDLSEYTKSTFSPKVGVVYQPILNKVSVFANYQNGFSYVNPELTVDPANPGVPVLLSFDLENADQFEGGIKTNLFNNKLETTLSYYNITVSNKVTGFGPTKQQDGEINSQGIEIDANAYPIEGLNVRGGFAYNDSKVVKSPSQPFLEGRRFGEAGAEFTYNFYADYRFLDGTLKNLGITFGFNGASEYNTMEGYPLVGEFILPAYTIFNTGLYYDHEKFRVGFNVNNLTNEQYFKGWSTLTPQQPRVYFGNLTYKF